MSINEKPIYSQPNGLEIAPATGLWSLVVPEATENLITDPSFENGIPSTSYLNAYNSTNVFLVDGADPGNSVSSYREWRYLRIEQAASNGYIEYGNFAQSVTDIQNGDVYLTWSMYFKGIAGETYKMAIKENGDVVDSGKFVNIFTATGDWQRVSVTSQNTYGIFTSIFYTLTLQKLTGTFSASAGYFTDCWQVEKKPYATTYIDGNMDTGRWTGTPYLSTSVRDADQYGGREYTFSGLGLRVTGFNGFGVAAPTNNVTPYAQVNGARYQSTRTPERIITIAAAVTANDLVSLHKTRATLASLLAPDISTGKAKNLMLRYRPIDETTGQPYLLAKELQMPVYYSSGLEGALDNRYQEVIALQFLEVQPPSIVDTRQGVFNMFANTLLSSTANLLYFQKSGGLQQLQRNTTVYSVRHDRQGGEAIGTDLGFYYNGYSFTRNGAVRAVLPVGPNEVYLGGAFTDAPQKYFAMYNGSAIVAKGADSFNGIVYGIALQDYYNTPGSPAIWAVGEFTTPGGKIARWNLATGWQPLFAGATLTGGATKAYCVLRASNNDVYIGGDFTNVYDGTNTYKYNNILKHTDSSVYGTNHDTNERLSDVSIYDETNAGTNGAVWSLAEGADGTIFVAGAFTTVGGTRAITANRIAAWTPATRTWKAVGQGFGDGQVNGLKYGNDGKLYAVGTFTQLSDGTKVGGAAVWDGSNWRPMALNTSVALYTVSQNFQSDIIIGGAQMGSNSYAGASSTINYKGTAAAFPKVIFYGPGVAKYVSNETTGHIIQLDNYTLATNETLTLNLDPLNLSLVSNIYGDVSSRISRGSDIGRLSLRPGKNTLRVLMLPNGGNVGKVSLFYHNRHWTFDAGVN